MSLNFSCVGNHKKVLAQTDENGNWTTIFVKTEMVSVPITSTEEKTIEKITDEAHGIDLACNANENDYSDWKEITNAEYEALKVAQNVVEKIVSP